MSYTTGLQNRRYVRRAILAGFGLAVLLQLLALPERIIGWSGLGFGTPAVLETPAFPEVIAEKPVQALRTPPSLSHLAFPAYAEWGEVTEASCFDCESNGSYGVETVLDELDIEALVQLENSSSSDERNADASGLASTLRAFSGGAGGVGSGLTGGGGGSLGVPTKAEDETSQQAAAAPAANDASDATPETSETGEESVAPPSLVSSAGGQGQDATAGPDDKWSLVEAGVIDPLETAGANPFETDFSPPDPRNVPPPAVPEPPAAPQPPTASPEPPIAGDEPPIAGDEPPTAADEPPIAPATPGVPDTPTTPTEPDTPAAPVPEPTQLILMGLGLSAVVYRLRKADR